MAEPTYIFKEGHVYTMVDGEVTAKVKESDFSPEAPPHEVEMPEVPSELEGVECPNCGQHTQPQDSYCPNCGTPLQGEGDPYGESANVETPMSGQAIAHQTVETPNGLKGRVLARVPDIWGEQVTVRFENGVIKQIPVDKSLTFASVDSTEGVSTTQKLEDRLAATYSSDRASLLGRGQELDRIRGEAREAVAGSSDEEAATLNKIYVQAYAEQEEIKQALDAIEASTAYEAPAPITSLPAVTQASIGGSKADWLDGVLNDMRVEANAVDYEKLMDEGPEAFVAGLTASQMADSGTTRAMAVREIRSHTAGADENVQDAYERVWLARVEAQRREQLKGFKEEVRKEASSDEPNHPVESLFL